MRIILPHEWDERRDRWIEYIAKNPGFPFKMGGWMFMITPEEVEKLAAKLLNEENE